jgi:hypothetical protein
VIAGGALAFDAVTVGGVIYVVGVLLGLARIDARPGPRVALAVLWPLGPLAFVVTLAVLIIASLIAFPLVGVVAAVIGIAFWLAR